MDNLKLKKMWQMILMTFWQNYIPFHDSTVPNSHKAPFSKHILALCFFNLWCNKAMRGYFLNTFQCHSTALPSEIIRLTLFNCVLDDCHSVPLFVHKGEWRTWNTRVEAERDLGGETQGWDSSVKRKRWVRRVRCCTVPVRPYTLYDKYKPLSLSLFTAGM